MNRRLALSSCLAVATAAWWSLSSEAPPPRINPVDTPAPLVETPPSRWVEGQQLRYALTSDVWVYTGERPDAPMVEMDGELELTVAEVGHARVLAVVRLVGLSVQPADATRGWQDLHQPSLVAFTPEGTLTGVACAADLTVAACQVLRSFVSTAQMSVADGPAWQTPEQDTDGLYTATYTRNDEGLEREKGDYRFVANPDGHDDGAESRVSGFTHFALHPSGHARRIEASHFLEVVQADAPSVHATEEIRFELVDLRQVDVPLRPLTEPLGAVARLLEDDPEMQARLDADLIDGLTLPEALAALAALDGDPSRDADRRRLALGMRISAMLRLDPRLAGSIGDHLRTASPTRGNGVLVAALGNAATPEALTELRALFDDEDFAVGAMTAVATSGRVDATTVEALAARSLDPTTEGYTAARALGAVGGPAAAETLLELVGSPDPRAHRAAIDGLGSAGDPRGLPHILAALDDPSLAPAATYALRNMPGAEVDGMLLQLLEDPEPIVAVAAASALHYRDPAHWRPLVEELLEGGTLPEPVRARLAQGL